jgi:CRP-like cAMP-binding protein
LIDVTTQTFAARFPALASNLTDSQIGVLLEAVQIHEVSAGEALIGEGTASDGLFLLWDGELDISLETVEGAQEVAHVAAGAFLGEVSLLDPGPATATVAAEQGCVALLLTRPKFDHLCAEHPDVTRTLLERLCQVLSSRIRTAEARLDSLALGAGTRGASTPERVRERILDVETSLYEGGQDGEGTWMR